MKRKCGCGAGEENVREAGMSGMRSFFFMEKNGRVVGELEKLSERM